MAVIARVNILEHMKCDSELSEDLLTESMLKYPASYDTYDMKFLPRTHDNAARLNPGVLQQIFLQYASICFQVPYWPYI